MTPDDLFGLANMVALPGWAILIFAPRRGPALNQRPAPGAAVVPLMGWPASVGDLRPAHFVSLHAMQVLPVLGWWVDRRTKTAGLVRCAAVVCAAVVCAAIALALFGQALMGQALMGVPAIRALIIG